MKRLFITFLVVVALVLGSLTLASCGESDFTATITPAPGGNDVVVTPTFTRTPQDIPHVYIIEDPTNPYIAGLVAESGGAICFECHGVPAQHQIWVMDPNICGKCHLVSENPVLVPR